MEPVPSGKDRNLSKSRLCHAVWLSSHRLCHQQLQQLCFQLLKLVLCEEEEKGG